MLLCVIMCYYVLLCVILCHQVSLLLLSVITYY